MAYEKQTWSSGDIITAEKLNHMEKGLLGTGTIFSVFVDPSNYSAFIHRSQWDEFWNMHIQLSTGIPPIMIDARMLGLDWESDPSRDPWEWSSSLGLFQAEYYTFLNDNICGLLVPLKIGFIPPGTEIIFDSIYGDHLFFPIFDQPPSESPEQNCVGEYKHLDRLWVRFTVNNYVNLDLTMNCEYGDIEHFFAVNPNGQVYGVINDSTLQINSTAICNGLVDDEGRQQFQWQLIDTTRSMMGVIRTVDDGTTSGRHLMARLYLYSLTSYNLQ